LEWPDHGPSSTHTKRNKTSDSGTTESPSTANERPESIHSERSQTKKSGFGVWKLNEQPHEPSQVVVPRWLQQANEFIQAIPSIEAWSEFRKQSKFHTVEENRSVIDLLLGKSNRIQSLEMEATPSISTDSPFSAWVENAHTYAYQTAALQADAKLSEKIAVFRELIVGSTCEIMIKMGVPRDDVDAVMNRCLGKTLTYKTLEGYREGACWANSCISALSANGWGNRGAEVFFLCLFP
jgi:hypothetical protein